MLVTKFEHGLLNIASLKDKKVVHNQLELQVFKKKCHLTPPLWVDGSQTP
jgi:hypothetical protein